MRKSTLRRVTAIGLLTVVVIAGVTYDLFLQKTGNSNSPAAAVPSISLELSGYELKRAIRDQEDKIEEWTKILARIENDARLKPYIQACVEKENKLSSIENTIMHLNTQPEDLLDSYAFQMAPENDALKKLYDRFSITKNKVIPPKGNESAGSAQITTLNEELQMLRVQLDKEILQLKASLGASLDQARLEYRRAYTIAMTQGAWPWESRNSCGMLMPSLEEAQKHYNIELERLTELKSIELRSNKRESALLKN